MDGLLIDRTRGAVLYRLGRHEPALGALQTASSQHLEGGKLNLHVYLALAHAKLGHEREAETWYAKALGAADDLLGPATIQRALLEEARALLEGEAPR